MTYNRNSEAVSILMLTTLPVSHKNLCLLNFSHKGDKMACKPKTAAPKGKTKATAKKKVGKK
jgi:hypothetical protein